jgi:hypothetical protein
MGAALGISELFARLPRRQIARTGLLICALALIATPLFGQTPFVPLTLPKDHNAPGLPMCGMASQPVAIDLSTTSTPGTTDPYWLVTKGISSPIAPYHTKLSAWTALSNNWVEPTKPDSNGDADSSAASGDYTYTTWFNLPCPPESYSNLQLVGSVAGDNNVTIYLNSFLLASCTNGYCFQGAGMPFTASAPFHGGINSLSVVVHNSGAYTGVSVSAVLNGTCVDNKMCVRQSGLLKVCKAAGLGVTVGTNFSFTANGSNPFTVPAGPAPSGTCVVGPRFPAGTQVNVKETGPAGYSVSNITVVPTYGPIARNLGVGGNVTFTMGNGVNEVTFTDKLQAFGDNTGYLEICKSGDVKGNFTFIVSPGAISPVVVPAGGCSPAIEVPAGPVDIKEMPNRGTIMLGCATIPANNLLNCDATVTQTATVTVPPGITNSTIAFISNGRIDDTVSGGSGPANPWWWTYQQLRSAPPR